MDNPSTTLQRSKTNSPARTALAEAQAQFDRAAERLRLDAAIRELLRSPMREHDFAIPVRMEDGTTASFIDVCETSERDQVSLRDAAYLIAVERTAQACRERGWA